MFRPHIIELGISETLYTYAGAPQVCRQLHRLLLPSVVSELAVNQFEAMYNYQKAILNGYFEVSTELSNINNLDQFYKLKTRQVETVTNKIY